MKKVSEELELQKHLMVCGSIENMKMTSDLMVGYRCKVHLNTYGFVLCCM